MQVAVLIHGNDRSLAGAVFRDGGLNRVEGDGLAAGVVSSEDGADVVL